MAMTGMNAGRTTDASAQMPSLTDIIKQMQEAQNAANSANELRYKQILDLYGEMGKAGETRIAQGEQQQQAKATQDLTSRGLGNTTVTSSVSRGISADAEQARQTLQEGIAGQKAGVMERRTDQGPDLGMFSNLIQAATAAQPKKPASSGLRWGPTGTVNASFNSLNPSSY